MAALGVPHTAWYSDMRFRTMTFRSLFGLTHLLGDYGISSRGIRAADTSEVTALTAPFLAQGYSGRFVIVTAINTIAGTVTYLSREGEVHMPIADFRRVWNGIALLAFPTAVSREPDVQRHRLTGFVATASGYALALTAAVVLIYFVVTRGIFTHVSTALIALCDCVGLYLSYLLLQKSLGIHTAASERVCGVLERGGCDRIIQLDVSKLFGVFSWSEVGFGYFGVSLVTMLLFPQMLPVLALCNLCCLPYTVWSIWYQRFRARHWCTLCVGVQNTLWALFFCYLLGGWYHGAFDPGTPFWVQLAVYVTAVLSLNRAMRALKPLLK